MYLPIPNSIAPPTCSKFNALLVLRIPQARASEYCPSAPSVPTQKLRLVRRQHVSEVYLPELFSEGYRRPRSGSSDRQLDRCGFLLTCHTPTLKDPGEFTYQRDDTIRSLEQLCILVATTTILERLSIHPIKLFAGQRPSSQPRQCSTYNTSAEGLLPHGLGLSGRSRKRVLSSSVRGLPGSPPSSSTSFCHHS